MTTQTEAQAALEAFEVICDRLAGYQNAKDIVHTALQSAAHDGVTKEGMDMLGEKLKQAYARIEELEAEQGERGAENGTVAQETVVSRTECGRGAGDVGANFSNFEQAHENYGLDFEKKKDAWGRDIYKHTHIQSCFEGWCLGVAANGHLRQPDTVGELLESISEDLYQARLFKQSGAWHCGLFLNSDIKERFGFAATPAEAIKAALEKVGG